MKKRGIFVETLVVSGIAHGFQAGTNTTRKYSLVGSTLRIGVSRVLKPCEYPSYWHLKIQYFNDKLTRGGRK